MTQKDYILLFVPILFNGVLIFIFQNIIKNKLERSNKRNALRDEILLKFFKELQNLNTLFIDVNVKAQNNPESIPTGLKKIVDLILSIIQFYDTNTYDLVEFKNEYEAFNNAWNNFTKTYKELVGKKLTTSDKIRLGSEMQLTKDKLKELINRVRENY